MKKISSYLTNQSLKGKWALTSAVVIFISFAVICSVLYLSIHSWLLNEQEQSVKRTMDDLTVFFESQGGRLTIHDIQSNKGLMNSIVDKNQTVRILNEDTVEMLRINDSTLKMPDLPDTIPFRGYAMSKEKVEKTEMFVATGPIVIGPFTGVIQLTHPLSTFESLMRYILIAMCILGLGALIASAGIGYFLATILLKPLNDLRLEMIKVAEQGFTAPITLQYDAKDEISDLLTVYRSMMGELEQSFLQQQQFISDASHELRTPIQVVEGHLSLIKRWGKDDPEVLEESLSTSLLEITRMKKLIEEMLELARREQNDLQNNADILIITTDIMNEVKGFSHDTTILLEVDPGESYQARISENAYGQILRNLLQNAVRYSEQQPMIQIRLSKQQHTVKIEVLDQGIGIAEEDQVHIFNRFYRVDSSRSRDGGGTGLGLSIVNMLVNKYQGTIKVSSKLHYGSTFSIYLPAEK
ncbi:GHKL domain-containing protein [Viridibacillus sp. YIM B01967]|uniref:Signal transduction histidine-protein kinase ArlS n=1 Tax=Viridibacillus soli TaxID=2798301 RepID=A0ABS1HBR0_9BACL|nr:HAMP domain-containing histidine kinase [Viridibacillus soli]MBK3496847.1 GHKL domain-containing protein [Viridibacillus soli]